MPALADLGIVRVILRYYPEWEAPDDNYREWVPTRCPFHADETASAAVSYELQAFKCLACGVGGDAISIIRHEEEVSFAEANRIAESLSVGGNVSVSRKPKRQSSRRVFSEQGAARAPSKAVRPGVRGRPTPWA